MTSSSCQRSSVRGRHEHPSLDRAMIYSLDRPWPRAAHVHGKASFDNERLERWPSLERSPEKSFVVDNGFDLGKTSLAATNTAFLDPQRARGGLSAASQYRPSRASRRLSTDYHSRRTNGTMRARSGQLAISGRDQVEVAWRQRPPSTLLT